MMYIKRALRAGTGLWNYITGSYYGIMLQNDITELCNRIYYRIILRNYIMDLYSVIISWEYITDLYKGIVLRKNTME